MTYDYGMSVQAIAKKTGTSPYMVQRSLDNTRRKYPELCRKGGSGSAAEEFERSYQCHPKEPEPMEKGFSSEAWDALLDKRTKATSPAAVVECLKTGMTVEATARHLGIRQSAVESIAAQVHDLGRQPQALLGAWRTGSTLKDLADKYSMTVFDIWRDIDREILNGCIRDRRGISKLTYSDVQALCQRYPSPVTVMMQEHNASRPEAEERVALARDYNKSVRSKLDRAEADKRQRNLILRESASPLFTAKEQRMLKYFDDGLWTSDIAERMQMKDDDVFDTLCGLIRRRDCLLEPLTPIELKILDRWDKGMSTADIAANLHLEVAGLQTLIVTLLQQRRALADAKASDAGDTRTIAERMFDHDIAALNKSIKDTAQEVRVMIRGAGLGKPKKFRDPLKEARTEDEQHILSIVDEMINDREFYESLMPVLGKLRAEFKSTRNYGQDGGGFAYYGCVKRWIERRYPLRGDSLWIEYEYGPVRIKDTWYNRICEHVCSHYRDHVAGKHWNPEPWEIVDITSASIRLRDSGNARHAIKLLMDGRVNFKGMSYAVKMLGRSGQRVSEDSVRGRIAEAWAGGAWQTVYEVVDGEWKQTGAMHRDEALSCARAVRDAFEIKYLGAALEGRPEVKTEFTTGIPRFGGGEASTTSAEGDTNMSELTYNRAKVIETGKANLDAHTKALAAATEAAAAAIKAYTEKVAPALVRGEQPEAKAPEIKVIADQTKTYEKHLRQLEHLSGDTVPSTAAVDFLLKDPEEVNRGVETEITLGVE